MAGQPPLVLASASPRRRALLEEGKYRFTVAPSNVPEISPPHFSPGETVLFNARAKCRAIALQRFEELVVGVDTEVALGQEVLGKPADMDAALAMLLRLNGRSHHVYSGLWLARLAKNQERGAIEVSTVYFKRLSEAKLRAYLERIGPLDKAGALLRARGPRRTDRPRGRVVLERDRPADGDAGTGVGADGGGSEE